MPTTPPAQGTSSSLDAHRAFILRVERLCREDKRARAELRRGLGRPYDQCRGMHRYLVKWTSEHTSLSTRAARYAVASLIAAAPNDAPASPAGPVTGSLGTSLGLAVRGGNMKAGSAEATLHLLTRQQRTTVTRSLPALARQIQRAGVAIDWGQLADDLARWDRDRDRVATRWLEHYYRASDVPDEAGSDHTTDDPDAGTDAGSDK